MSELKTTKERVLNVLDECPEARYALEILFPELKRHKKQTKTLVVTEASFQGNDIGGRSKEGKLTNFDLLWDYKTNKPREFTKITFEWEE